MALISMVEFVFFTGLVFQNISMDIREIARRAKVSTAAPYPEQSIMFPLVDPQLAKRVWKVPSIELRVLPEHVGRGLWFPGEVESLG